MRREERVVYQTGKRTRNTTTCHNMTVCEVRRETLHPSLSLSLCTRVYSSPPFHFFFQITNDILFPFPRPSITTANCIMGVDGRQGFGSVRGGHPRGRGTNRSAVSSKRRSTACNEWTFHSLLLGLGRQRAAGGWVGGWV
jgi:hypothetical protein